MILSHLRDILSLARKKENIIMNKEITMLVIDNNENYARDLSDFAKELPDFLEADYITNCNGAYEKISFINPTVIVVDIIMPGMNIIEFMKWLRGIYGEDKPFVMINSVVLTDTMIKTAANNGVDYFMIKPHPHSEICKIISDTIIHKSAEAVPQMHTEDSTEVKISHFLHCMGIPAHLNGYNYIRSSLKLAINDISTLDPITKKLYPMIGKEYNKSPQCIERSIRHAIKVSWERGNKKTIHDIFGISPENLSYPTNSEYIAMLADDLRLRLKHNISI